MSKYVVSRAIEGVTINGDEYLLDDDGSVREFDSVDEVLELLQTPSREELEHEGIFISEAEASTR